MEGYEQTFWKKVFMPGRKNPVPSVLRTHPHTEARIVRLLDMAEEMDARPDDCPDSLPLFSGLDAEDGGHGHGHWLKSWLSHDG
jgi:hypothetical protein